MTEQSNIQQAVDLLLELGLKEYEARCFVALTRFETATAKEISDVSAVPRTRVYDAIRVLESKGLVEVQHTNPKQYRATSTDEAIATLQNEYVSRMNRLRQMLRDIEPVPADSSTEVTHEVWALTGRAAIENRMVELLGEADREIVLVVESSETLDDRAVEALRAAQDRGVTVILGTPNPATEAELTERLPDVEVFVSGLEWLASPPTDEDSTQISRLLLLDRSKLLVSSYVETTDGNRTDERAVFGHGLVNGIVAVVRRLLSTGFIPTAEAESRG